jgi:CheY-like chemotaxis protein
MYSNTILLVQPRVDSLPHLRTRLEDKGYTVVEATDSATAMAIVNRSEVALVVTDLYLPVGRSRCLARVIGKSPALQRTKLLAYTAHGKREDRDWARRIGADGYVITRSGEERFLSVVDRLMTGASSRRQGGSRTP